MFGKRLSLRKLKAMAGREVGVSDWFPVTQERIDAFAAVTEDRQWIHVDPERAARARAGPYRPISLNFAFSLSLLT